MKNNTKIILSLVTFCLILSIFITYMVNKFGVNFDSYSTLMSYSSDSPSRMKMSYKYFQGTKSRKINVKKAEVLVIHYKSTITKGTLNLKVLDDKGNTLKLLEGNTSGEENIVAEENEKIKISIEGKKTSGNYEVTWSKQQKN